MRNDELMIEVPAKLLQNLVSLAGGYSMNRGQFISRSVIDEANFLLYVNGYETYNEPIPELRTI